MEFHSFLIKYGEIGVKGKNRVVFEDALCQRIRVALRPVGHFSVLKYNGRIYAESTAEFDYDEVTGFCGGSDRSHKLPIVLGFSDHDIPVDCAVRSCLGPPVDDIDFVLRLKRGTKIGTAINRRVCLDLLHLHRRMRSCAVRICRGCMAAEQAPGAEARHQAEAGRRGDPPAPGLSPAASGVRSLFALGKDLIVHGIHTGE